MHKVETAKTKAEYQMLRKKRLLDIADSLTPGHPYTHRELMRKTQREYGVAEGTAIGYVESLRAMGLLKDTGVRFVELNYDELLKQLIKPKN
jgi:hypothetical protein